MDTIQTNVNFDPDEMILLEVEPQIPICRADGDYYDHQNHNDALRAVRRRENSEP